MPVSDVFEGLSHADRLALVFTALHDELAATSLPSPPPPLSSPAASTTPATPTLFPNTPPQPSLFPSTRPISPKENPGEPSATEGNEGFEKNTSDVFDLDNQSADRGDVSPRHPGGDSDSGGAEGEARAARERRTEEGQGEGEGAVEVAKAGNRRGVERGDIKGDGSGRGREREGVGDLREENGSSGSANHPVDAVPTPNEESAARPVDPGAAYSPDDDSGEEDHRTENSRRRRRRPLLHRVVRGGVKASYVGPNVEALPVWGALDAIAGSALLVDCRTPAQWRADEYRPTAKVACMRL